MPATNVTNAHLDTSVLDKMTAEMRPRAKKIIEKYGLAIAGDAAQGAPVDTGALRNSITSESRMTGEMTFTAQDGVGYGIFQELGTSRLSARPFMVPAVEKWRERFYAAFAELFR